MAHSDTWRTRSDRWIPCIFGLILALKISSVFMLSPPSLALNQAYMTLIVLLIGTLALQQSLRASLLGMVLGLSGFAVAPLFDARAGFTLLFLGQYLFASFVTLFVSYVQEDRARVSFLNLCLLNIEKDEVDRLARQLATQASRDGLTGLYNRRHIDQCFKTEWDRALRNHSTLAVLMIDVDHFKRYNDHHGHPAGDQCLVELGRLISQVAQRPADVAARYGGEEFMVLLPETNMSGASDLARSLIALLEAAAIPHGDSPTAQSVTVSIGVSACAPLATMARQDLLVSADQALYRAKQRGRNRLAAQALTPPAAPALDRADPDQALARPIT